MRVNTETANSIRKKITGKAMIVFFVFMILLTFFSNTINNFSLPKVTVENPGSGSLVKEVTGTGTVRPNKVDEYTLNSQLEVKEVKVKVGDQVKKDQVLFALDIDDIEKQIKDEEARITQKRLNMEKLLGQNSKENLLNYDKAINLAKQAIDNTEEDYENQQKQYENGVADIDEYKAVKKTYDNAKMDYEIALNNKEKFLKDIQQDIQNAQIDLDIEERTIAELREKLKLKEITAPADGTIQEINFDEGTFANSSKPLYKLSETASGFEFVTTVDSTSAELVSIGDAATIVLNMQNGDVRQGSIKEIKDNVQQVGTKKDIFIDIQSDGLLGGESGSVEIVKNTKNYTTLVHTSAIGQNQTGSFVYVLREKKGPLGNEYYVQAVSVSTDDSDSLRSAILNGVSNFDRVIVSTDKPLSDGMRVYLKN
ncbi:MAG: efflux RND transporter periplasmic adaptor subunit [Clostridia bacterium]|nr:efflux RND transporter periplasmic adaptor subunit [Clostridia bacterium]